MTWLKNLVLGAAAFTAAHAVEVYRWRDWFDLAGSYRPWFLNAGSAVAMTAAVVAVAAAGGAMLWARNVRDAGRQSLGVAAGAALAMATTLVIIGAGNIFPIVLIAGTGVMTVSAVVGGWLGFVAASALGAVLDRPESP